MGRLYEEGTAYERAEDALRELKPVWPDRKTAHWVLHCRGVWTNDYLCSGCGNHCVCMESMRPKFCGNCGAEMRDEEIKKVLYCENCKYWRESDEDGCLVERCARGGVMMEIDHWQKACDEYFEERGSDAEQ